jgi:predicted nucleotidyltransferase component of viral defense system
MIRQAEISKFAYQLGLGEKTIEKDYVLTWVLFAIAQSSFRTLLAFKGGTAIKKIYIPDYRFSEDLDFTFVASDLSNHEIIGGIEALIPWLNQEVNLQLAVENFIEHETSNLTVYLNYSGPLGSQMGKRSLKIDVSKDEALVFPLETKHINAPYSDCSEDFGFLQVYSMKEILIEKLRSLLSRSEPRDLFDVHYILTNQLVDIEEVSFYCLDKFSPKNVVPSDLRTVLERKEKTFKQYWHQRLDGQMPEIPEFETVVRETSRILSSYF